MSILSLVQCASFTKADPAEFDKLVAINEVDLTKDKIFDRAREWLARNYSSSKEVIELADKENGKIIGKVMKSQMYSGMIQTYIHYTILLEIKEKKFRLKFETIYMYIPNQAGGVKQFKDNRLESELEAIQEEFKVTNKSLVDFCSKESIKSSDF